MSQKVIEYYRNNTYTECGIVFNKVNHDMYGNPRYVCHFLEFIKEEENELPFLQRYAIAKKRANKLGFSVYRAKWYGGGFVVQSYNLHETAKNILDMTNN